MNKTLRIGTPYGNHYIVDLESGNMARHIYGQAPQYSDGWKFVGLCHVQRNTFIRLEVIRADPSILDRLTLRFKNGQPQWTVADNDHGTLRTWGNTIHHGVASLSHD